LLLMRTTHSLPLEILLLLRVLGCAIVAYDLLNVLHLAYSDVEASLTFLFVGGLKFVVCIPTLFNFLLFLYTIQVNYLSYK
jgi:hypothetical protein